MIERKLFMILLQKSTLFMLPRIKVSVILQIKLIYDEFMTVKKVVIWEIPVTSVCNNCLQQHIEYVFARIWLHQINMMPKSEASCLMEFWQFSYSTVFSWLNSITIGILISCYCNLEAGICKLSQMVISMAIAGGSNQPLISQSPYLIHHLGLLWSSHLSVWCWPVSVT